MADIVLEPASLTGLDTEIAGIRIVERDDLIMVSAAVPIGGDKEFTKALKGLGLEMPTPVRAAMGDDRAAMMTAADQVMVVAGSSGEGAAYSIQSAFGGAAYTTDQTGAWIILDVSGENVLTALERLCPIDLDESVFEVGAFARTVMEHMGAIILRLGPTKFRLFSASSSALSFGHAVVTSCRYVASD